MTKEEIIKEFNDKFGCEEVVNKFLSDVLDSYAFSIVEQALPPADFMAAPPLKTSLENAKAGGFNLCRQQIREKARTLTNQTQTN